MNTKDLYENGILRADFGWGIWQSNTYQYSVSVFCIGLIFREFSQAVSICHGTKLSVFTQSSPSKKYDCLWLVKVWHTEPGTCDQAGSRLMQARHVRWGRCSLTTCCMILCSNTPTWRWTRLLWCEGLGVCSGQSLARETASPARVFHWRNNVEMQFLPVQHVWFPATRSDREVASGTNREGLNCGDYCWIFFLLGCRAGTFSWLFIVV